MGFKKVAGQYRTALFDDVIPFWQKHSIDREHGGFFTCLNRDGSVFDTDKFVWLQARQMWMFSLLYNRVEQKQEWLDIAHFGADFLKRYGRADDGSWYFSLTREGRPLIQPFSIFSDCFAALAYQEYGEATNSEAAKLISYRTFQGILKRMDNPKREWNKSVPGTRPMRSLAVPMITANLTQELMPLLDEEQGEETIRTCVNDILTVHLDKEMGILRESVAPDGSVIDSIEGRTINPGHGIEATWFVMSLAEQRFDRSTIEKAVDILLKTVEYGWDTEFGGIYYFMDSAGHPPGALEWNQKLWWVHLEALVALLMAYRLTSRRDCLAWYERVHDWTWSHFPDPEFGEWWGYLDRRGEVLTPMKGGKWKGCFHVPRGLYLCMRECEKLIR
jgi:N-acylglucosamine 2-epimerase